MAKRLIRDTTNSEKVNKLSFSGEVFFNRLMMKADDHGCFYGNPKLVRAALYPLRLDPGPDHVTTDQVSAWIRESISAELVTLYNAEGKPFLHIRNFGQRLRSSKRKFPVPPEENENPRTNVSDPPTTGNTARPETEADTEVEADTESEVEGEKSQKSFFRLQGKLYKQGPGDYWRSVQPSIFEVWQMQHPKEQISVQVLERMNREYLGHDFNDVQHMQNTFKKIWKDEAKQTPIQNTSTGRAHRKG